MQTGVCLGLQTFLVFLPVGKPCIFPEREFPNVGLEVRKDPRSCPLQRLGGPYDVLHSQ